MPKDNKESNGNLHISLDPMVLLDRIGDINTALSRIETKNEDIEDSQKQLLADIKDIHSEASKTTNDLVALQERMENLGSRVVDMEKIFEDFTQDIDDTVKEERQTRRTYLVALLTGALSALAAWISKS